MAVGGASKPVSFLDAYVLLSPRSQAWIREMVESLLESEARAAQLALSRTPEGSPTVVPLASRKDRLANLRVVHRSDPAT